jgi:hypothetical protein
VVLSPGSAEKIDDPDGARSHVTMQVQNENEALIQHSIQAIDNLALDQISKPAAGTPIDLSQQTLPRG